MPDDLIAKIAEKISQGSDPAARQHDTEVARAQLIVTNTTTFFHDLREEMQTIAAGVNDALKGKPSSESPIKVSWNDSTYNLTTSKDAFPHAQCRVTMNPKAQTMEASVQQGNDPRKTLRIEFKLDLSSDGQFSVTTSFEDYKDKVFTTGKSLATFLAEQMFSV